jgi:hypothetical protein
VLYPRQRERSLLLDKSLPRPGEEFLRFPAKPKTPVNGPRRRIGARQLIAIFRAFGRRGHEALPGPDSLVQRGQAIFTPAQCAQDRTEQLLGIGQRQQRALIVVIGRGQFVAQLFRLAGHLQRLREPAQRLVGLRHALVVIAQVHA